jgi:hypothetical protein
MSDSGAVVDGRLAVSWSRVHALRADVSDWLARRVDADVLEQFATQLKTIEGLLLRSIDAVAATIPTTGDEVAEVYERCRLADRRTVWVGEGNLIELVRRCGDAIGEIQVADVPGRCQPGIGEIYYPAVAKALHDMGYRGTVSLEGYAEGDDVAALEAFRAAFTVWPFSGRRARHGLTGVPVSLARRVARHQNRGRAHSPHELYE